LVVKPAKFNSSLILIVLCDGRSGAGFAVIAAKETYRKYPIPIQKIFRLTGFTLQIFFMIKVCTKKLWMSTLISKS